MMQDVLARDPEPISSSAHIQRVTAPRAPPSAGQVQSMSDLPDYSMMQDALARGMAAQARDIGASGNVPGFEPPPGKNQPGGDLRQKSNGVVHAEEGKADYEKAKWLKGRALKKEDGNKRKGQVYTTEI